MFPSPPPFRSDDGRSRLVRRDRGRLSDLRLVQRPARKRLEAIGRPTSRLVRYGWTILTLWLITAVIAAAWHVSGRGWAEIGLDAAPGLNFILGSAAAALGSAYLLLQAVQVTRNPEQLAELSDMLARMEGVDKVVPRTPAERTTFRALSVTAGITEEFIFRGFLLWAFAHWLPMWAAALASLAIFVVLHLYQESWNALTRVAIAGAVFTVLTVLSGSLLPAMVLHAAVDLTSGAMTSAARRAAEAAPA